MTDEIDRILEDRGAIYGPAEDCLLCAQRLKLMYRFWNGPAKMNCHHGGHNEAIEMVLHKIARIATGKPHLDNYNDAIGYLKLARQLAFIGEEKCETD